MKMQTHSAGQAPGRPSHQSAEFVLSSMADPADGGISSVDRTHILTEVARISGGLMRVGFHAVWMDVRALGKRGSDGSPDCTAIDGLEGRVLRIRHEGVTFEVSMTDDPASAGGFEVRRWQPLADTPVLLFGINDDTGGSPGGWWPGFVVAGGDLGDELVPISRALRACLDERDLWASVADRQDDIRSYLAQRHAVLADSLRRASLVFRLACDVLETDDLLANGAFTALMAEIDRRDLLGSVNFVAPRTAYLALELTALGGQATLESDFGRCRLGERSDARETIVEVTSPATSPTPLATLTLTEHTLRIASQRPQVDVTLTHGDDPAVVAGAAPRGDNGHLFLADLRRTLGDVMEAHRRRELSVRRAR